MPTFRNSVLHLPPDVKTEIDQLIDQDSSGQAIYRSLTAKYGTQLKVPSLPTILKYVRYYNSQKMGIQKQIIEERLVSQFQNGVQEIETLIAKVSQGQDQATFNKVRVLEGLVAKCMLRIHSLELTQSSATRPNTAVEQAIARYIAEVKSIIESIIKMSSSIQQDEQTLIQVINVQSNKFLEVVRDIVLEVCPERYDTFRTKLESKLRDQKLFVQPQIEQPVELPTQVEQLAKELDEPFVVPSEPPTELTDKDIEEYEPPKPEQPEPSTSSPSGITI